MPFACQATDARASPAAFGDVTSDLLHLVVPDLHRRLAPEDGDQDLELARVLVDLGDLTGEVRQRPGDHLHRFADRELSPRRPRDRHLAVEQAIDLGLGQRDRLVRRADEPRDSRRALHDLPGILLEVHVHEHGAGHCPLLARDLLVRFLSGPFLFSFIPWTVSVGTTTWRTARAWFREDTRCSRFCLTLFSCPE